MNDRGQLGRDRAHQLLNRGNHELGPGPLVRVAGIHGHHAGLEWKDEVVVAPEVEWIASGFRDHRELAGDDPHSRDVDIRLRQHLERQELRPLTTLDQACARGVELGAVARPSYSHERAIREGAPDPLPLVHEERAAILDQPELSDLLRNGHPGIDWFLARSRQGREQEQHRKRGS